MGTMRLDSVSVGALDPRPKTLHVDSGSSTTLRKTPRKVFTYGSSPLHRDIVPDVSTTLLVSQYQSEVSRCPSSLFRLSPSIVWVGLIADLVVFLGIQ